MTAKNFINFHVLISHSPSCLNRDDMNMQKTAVFGGVNRVRISSQSLKHAMRKSVYYATHLGESSFRTRSLERATAQLVDALKDEFDDTKLVEDAAHRFVAASMATDEDAEESESRDADENAEDGSEKKKLAVAPWVKEEIRVLCRLIKEVKQVGLTDEEKEKALKNVGKTEGKGKDKKTLTEADCLSKALDKKINKKIKENIQNLRAAIGSAADVVLAGRMATSGLMLPVDGALAVAHTITTHAVEPQDVDWFTAVDDLTQDSGETGAGHLNTQQFSAGVFYRYASLNLKQLQVNLGLLPDMKAEETTDSRKKALEIADHVFHMLTTVVPSAKQRSFAAHNPADFALVSFSDQPISLANAFETPVQRGEQEGFLDPSIKAILKYWERINDFYSLNEIAATASSREMKPSEKLKVFAKLEKLREWITSDSMKQ